MPTELPRGLLEIKYEKAAEDYLRKLPLEHFMESTTQAGQREITLESLALVRAVRPEVQVFNELLVQYPLPRRRKPRQVVPDNMVVVCKQPIKAVGSFNLPLQPVGPFWVLEYTSKHTKRKDYEDNMHKYEHELKVPYYLLFAPDADELTLYHHTGQRYGTVTANANGRYAVAELELEVALLDGWVRYWHQGELLELPGDLRRRLKEADRRAEAADRRAEAADRRAEAADRRAEAVEEENARLRAELERFRGQRGERG
jgi:Uma2 family endonuclease